jgi:hypothetical protein
VGHEEELLAIVGWVAVANQKPRDPFKDRREGGGLSLSVCVPFAAKPGNFSKDNAHMPML